MKKIFLLLAIVAVSLTGFSQTYTTKLDVKNDINAKIIPNSSRAITADVMKKILLGLWDFDVDSLWLDGPNIKYRRGGLVFTVPFVSSFSLVDTTYLHRGQTETVWGTKNFLNYTTGLAPGLGDSSNKFPTTAWIRQYIAAHGLGAFTETDPIWNADKTNYYTKGQADAIFTPLSRILSINGVAHDLSIDRSWTIPVLDTMPLHNQIITKLSAEADPKRTTNITFTGNDSVHTLVLTRADGVVLSASFFDRGSGGGGGSSFDTAYIYHYIDSLNASIVETDPVWIADSSNHYTKAAANAIYATKEPVIISPNLAGKYWNGFKNFVSFNTDSIPAGFTNKYDQTVSISNGGNIIVTGTYPNFTLKADTTHSATHLASKYYVDSVKGSIAPTLTEVVANGNSLSNQSIYLGNNSYLQFDNGFGADVYTIESNNTGLQIGNETTFNEAKLNFSGLTATHTYTFPNANGTIALTSDIVAETDPIANAKTITETQGSGILITGTAGQTLTSNPSWIFKIDSSLISTKYNVNNAIAGIPTPTLQTVTTAGNTTTTDINTTSAFNIQDGSTIVGSLKPKSGTGIGGSIELFDVNSSNKVTIYSENITANRNQRLIDGNGGLSLFLFVSAMTDLPATGQEGVTYKVSDSLKYYRWNSALNSFAGAYEELINGSTVTTPDLQAVTNVGSTSTNTIYVQGLGKAVGVYNPLSSAASQLGINATTGQPYLNMVNLAGNDGTIYADTLTGSRTYQLPDKSGTFALLSDITDSISGIATHGLDDVLAVNQLLTTNRSINLGTNNLTITNGDLYMNHGTMFGGAGGNIVFENNYSIYWGTFGSGPFISATDGDGTMVLFSNKLFENGVTRNTAPLLKVMAIDTLSKQVYYTDVSSLGGGTGSNLSYDATNHEVDIDGGGTSAVIPLSVADGSTKGIASFTAADFNASSGNISIDYVNGQLATNSVNGFMSATDHTTLSTALQALPPLSNGKFWVGNGSNVATAVTPTGDVVFDNAGVFNISSGVIVNADVNASAAIAYSKLNLATSIVNADINGSAAIAYSKLNLAGSIVNADITNSTIDLTAKVTGLLPDANIATASNWNTAYTDRNKWDGGATGLTASTGRTSLGGTTIGQNIFTSTNPAAVTFGRANADNTFDWLSASAFRTAIGAGTGDGTVTSVSGTANQIASTGGATPVLSLVSGGTLPGAWALGTPTSLVGTNITGTASGFTAGNVTTNANLTGPVTSTGNATAIANGAITNSMLANSAVANLSNTNTGDQTTAGTTNRITVTNGSTNPVIDISSSYVGQSSITTVGTLASPTLTTPVINGTITGTGQATAATASTIAMRDDNGNLSANNWINSYASTATAAGTTTLTVGSSYQQNFTGVTTQTVTLPVVSTLSLGTQYLITNNSSGNVTINSSGGNAVVVLAGGTSSILTSNATTGTDQTVWYSSYSGINVASGKKVTQNNSITYSGTDNTTMTFPTTSATIARTDAANTFTGHQTIEGVTSTGATGTGKFIFDNTPTLITPVLGTPTSVTLNNTSDVIGGVTMILGSDATNDMYYRNSSGVLTRFASGNNGVVITSSGGVPSVSSTIPTATQSNITTVGTIATGTWNGTEIPNNYAQLYSALGSTIKAETIGVSLANVTTTAALASGTLRFTALWLPKAQTLTGVKWYQQAQGVYTSNNYNGVGLYTYSGGTLTLVASSTDDGTIWKAAAASFASKAFTSTYAASAGLYFVAFLYSTSAQTTAPTFGAVNIQSNTLSTADFTNSARISGTLGSQTSMPSSITMSLTGALGNLAYVALY